MREPLPITESLTNVNSGNRFCSLKIRQRPGDTQHPVITTSGKAHHFCSILQQSQSIPVRQSNTLQNIAVRLDIQAVVRQTN